METLIVSVVLLSAAIAAWSWPAWRLGRALRQPPSASMLAILRQNVPVYQRMSPELQAQMTQLVQQFLYQKKFIGCDGLVVTEEMRVTIAAQASLLLLNRASRVYPALRTVLLYPGAFQVPRRQVDAAGVVTEERQDLLGESWDDGRVVLAWDHVRRAGDGRADGQNVVLHEFAHQLDSESGTTNGAPYLGSQAHYRRWSQVLSRDFAALRHDAMWRQDSVIDHYGATSPAEFFAVVTETFFERPWHMAERHPALYAQFEQYYRVDPRLWQDAPPRATADFDAQARSEGKMPYGAWR
jgi:Mlc titration factor MtfA (ptsG expression regulator)